MSELSQKLGKLSLAILENFVEKSLGEKFVNTLRQPTDRELAFELALSNSEIRFAKEFNDKHFAQQMFTQVSEQHLGILSDAIEKFYDHPADSDLPMVLNIIVTNSFPDINKEKVDSAVNLYVNVLTEEFMLADDLFREKLRGLSEIRSLGTLRKVETLLSQREKATFLQSNLAFLHQLPAPPADFTGRDMLIQEIFKLFEVTNHTNVIALTGMPGVGKTALGLVIGTKLVDTYSDGQIFLDLRGTTQPLKSIDVMRHLILSFEPTTNLQLLDEGQITAAFQSILHRKRVLIFLDNVRDSEQIASLHIPNTCALLITSRWNISVAGLKIFNTAIFSHEEAKQFLLHLCPRLGNRVDELAKACGYLPLALRISGSFLKTNSNWPIERYISQIKDRSNRLKTFMQNRNDADLMGETDLSVTFALSYNHLSTKNQRYWRTLGIFAVSFDIFAAQVMWSLDEKETLRLLGLLRRYSLIDYDESSSRYSLHDLLSDYALVQMESTEEQTLRFNHSLLYTAIMQHCDILYKQGGDNLLQGLLLFDTEWENIRSGRQWAVANMSELAEAAQICNYTMNVYCLDLRLRPNELLSWLEDSLRASRILNDTRAEGIHLGNIGVTMSELSMWENAINYLNQAFEIGQKIGDKENSIGWLVNLANASLRLGKIRKAIDLLESALLLTKEIGDIRTEGSVLGNLGTAHLEIGESNKAIDYYEQGLLIARKTGNYKSEGNALNNLGLAYSEIKQLDKAVDLFRQCFEIAKRLADKGGEGGALVNLGNIYLELDEHENALQTFESALIIQKELNNIYAEGIILGNLGLVYYKLGNYEKAISLYEEALAIGRKTGHRLGLANTLLNRGLALYYMKKKQDAIASVRDALEIYREIESPNTVKAQEFLTEWETVQ